MRPRSALFAPGDQRRKLTSALESSADAVVFDLEDGVAPDAKAEARDVVVEVLSGSIPADSPPVFVRINPPRRGGREDIEALAAGPSASIAGVVLPKTDGPETVGHVRGLLRDAGISTRLWCLVETAAGVLAAPEIARHGAVDALVFGGEDLATDLGADPDAEGTEVAASRQQVVLAARAAEIPVIAGITATLDDDEQVRTDAERARRLGFDGKLAIHPKQVTPIHETFTPSDTKRDWARRVVKKAETTDAGVFRLDGEMIDAPMIARARRILERARNQ